MEPSPPARSISHRLRRPCGRWSKASKRRLRRFAPRMRRLPTATAGSKSKAPKRSSKTCTPGSSRSHERNRNLEDRNRRLEHLVRELRRAMFAKKSEKLHPDQLLLAFEELEGALAEAEGRCPRRAPRRSRARSARAAQRRNIGHLPAHLPRVFDVIEPQSTLCPCGCGEMTKIGEDRTERLHVVPAKLQVIVTVRPKYACRQCEEGVTQAPAPAHLIEGALPTEGMIAHVLVSKFADHLPLYRQSQIYARSGVDLHRSTLADWVGKASFHLRPVFECLKAQLKTSNNLGLDETTVRVLDPGRGKTKTGYMWTMTRDERGWSGPDPPGVRV